MYKKIQKELIDCSDSLNKYDGKMPINLVPNISAERFLNVRIPKMREIAKNLAKGDYWSDYIKNNRDKYIEETTIEGLIIGYLKVEETEKLKYIRDFVEKIDNWITCDVVCSTLKFKNKELLWNFIVPYGKCKDEFKIRFFAVMVMSHFIDDEHVKKILDIFDNIKTNDYYAQMGIAWALSTIYVKCKEITLNYFNNCNLDTWIYNKSLQKIIESNRVTRKEKEEIRKMKRKK